MTHSANITSEYWAIDRQGDRPRSWIEHKVILNFVHRRVSGDPNIGTYEWFRRSFIPEPANLCLSLGCGFGAFERSAISVGIAKQFHAYDLSHGAIEKARQASIEAGLSERIQYWVQDLDEIVLPENNYDAVFAIMSAHHVSSLENLFLQCRKTLKPGGLFFLDEYIGPNRFQTLPIVTDIINRFLLLLPKRYRNNLFANDGTTIDRYIPSPVEHFMQTDPSEAVRSADIVKTLELHFDIVEFRPYGGAILHMLLSGIVGNFDETIDYDVSMLNIIATFEELLEQSGIIESDFAAIVARPKD